MGTWSGWIIQFLNRASILNTPPLQTFMSEWSSHDGAQCKNAPLTLSTPVAGSTRCGATVTPLGRTQNYATHADAAHAFTIQINLTVMRPLRAALDSGNPFQIGDRSAVVAALKHWGSPQFANWYATATVDGQGGGGGGTSTKAPHTHTGWTDLRRSVNHNMPVAIRHSIKLTNRALRSLGQGHRLRG